MVQYDIEWAKSLAERFISELEEEIGKKIIWFYTGSIFRNRYVAGKSDIDLAILPRDYSIFTFEEINIILKLVEEYKKFGVVIKKGREISLIDPLIVLHNNIAEEIRKRYYEINPNN